MTTELATRPQNGLAQQPPVDAETLEKVVVGGDLSNLTPTQRVAYYRGVCESLGLNPLTQPFAYITLNGKLTLYATRTATDQLRAKRGVTVQIVSRETLGDLYVVTSRATLPNGRSDEEIGAVSVGSLRGEALANAMMKAGTKSKRRVTLSICGLGWLDESEADSVPGARLVAVDDAGEIADEDAPNALDVARQDQDTVTPREPAEWEAIVDEPDPKQPGEVVQAEAPPATGDPKRDALIRQMNALGKSLRDAGRDLPRPAASAPIPDLEDWIGSAKRELSAANTTAAAAKA